jgi:hypothetical protein
MDPFLEDEKHWNSFHSYLIHGLYQILLPSLSDRYRARVGERVYELEQVLFTSVTREERREPFIEIRQRSDGRLITLVDAVSPVNKTTTGGREAYLEKRQEVMRVRANVVEIDLVLQGTPLHDFSREKLPEWDYAVLVTRAARPEQWEIYTATIDKRLPRFRLPLAADDRDTVVDLQVAVQRAYDQGSFASTVNYLRDPLTRLSDGQKQWIAERLQEQNVR